MRRDYGREPFLTVRRTALSVVADYATEALERVTPELESYVLERLREQYAPTLPDERRSARCTPQRG